ncbi:MAG: DUF87 domain-containing protein, partial [Armatimonadetes bacterium]|nr:DUF87 domain-containing protein [Armatimonadota bacterium]
MSASPPSSQSHSRKDSFFTIGAVAPGTQDFTPAKTRVYWDSSELRSHKGKPWVAEYLYNRHGLRIADEPALDVGTPVALNDDLFARHAVIVGKAGSGKTRFALHLLREQLRLGRSAVVIDIKDDTIQHALSCAREVGFSNDQITLLWPRSEEEGVPEWNPFAVPHNALRQAVREFVAVIKANVGEVGGRMWDVLTNAATIIASQGLSPYELVRFLQNAAYMEKVLERAKGTDGWENFTEAYEYFELEFGALSKSGRADFAGPVLNKIRTLVDTPYLKALFCAERDTVDLAELWQKPRLIAVYLDSYTLGRDGAKLLAGMLTRSLFATAFRVEGPVRGAQVWLVTADTLAMARSRGLRMLAVTQHLDQLSIPLRNSLLTSTAVRAFFQLGAPDAPAVSKTLATGIGGNVEVISLDSEETTSSALMNIMDSENYPIFMPEEAWEAFISPGGKGASEQTLLSRRYRALQAVANMNGSEGLFVHFKHRSAPYPLKRLLEGASAETLSFGEKQPCQLKARFPKPKYKILQQSSEEERARGMARALMSLPERTALLRLEDGTTCLTQIADIDFSDKPFPVTSYLQGGRSREHIRDLERRRRAEMEAVLSFTPPAPEEVKASPSSNPQQEKPVEAQPAPPEGAQ